MFRKLGAALVLSLGFHGAALAVVIELSPLPGYDISYAHAINESGQVVGYSYAYGPVGSPDCGDEPNCIWGAKVSATFWDQQGALDLSLGRANNAIDINDAGQIVGVARGSDYYRIPSATGAINESDMGGGGSGNFAALAPSSSASMPITIHGCFMDPMLYAISNTGYMLGGFGNGSGPSSIHSPNLDTFLCGMDILALYENGIALTSFGYVFDPLVDGTRQWVVVPTCDGEVTAYAMSPVDESIPGVDSVPAVPSQEVSGVAEGICGLAADDYVRDRHRNASGEYIVNVGNRAFLYTTSVPEPSTLALLAIGLAGLAFRSPQARGLIMEHR